MFRRSASRNRHSRRFLYHPQNTSLAPAAYILVVAATGSVAVAQLYFLPLWLGPAQFGILALALSATQAVQQFGDLGFSNAAARSHLGAHTRKLLREYSLSIGTILAAIAVAACGITYVFATDARAVVPAIALALIAGWSLSASKLRANARHQSGDEKGAAVENAIWQNAPKIGMVGAITGSSTFAMVGALLTSVLAGKPRLPRVWPRISYLSLTARLWGPGLVLVFSAFVASWIDTYVLGIVGDVAAVGAYQAVQRPLLGITYVYLPLLSLMQASLNGGRWKRANRAALISIALMVTGLVAIGAGLVLFGEYIWSMYRFPIELVSLLSTAVLFAGLSAVLGTYLLVMGKHTLCAFGTLLGCGVMTIAALILVPSTGATGAAIASLCGWIVSSFVQGAALLWVYSRRGHVVRGNKDA